MDPFATELNLLFMHTYRSIHNVEEAMLKSLSNGSLSIGEMHIIECIGRGGKNGASITAIAQDMEISLPSATVTGKCSRPCARACGRRKNPCCWARYGR